jgi:hypothetical protein
VTTTTNYRARIAQQGRRLSALGIATPPSARKPSAIASGLAARVTAAWQSDPTAAVVAGLTDAAGLRAFLTQRSVLARPGVRHAMRGAR